VSKLIVLRGIGQYSDFLAPPYERAKSSASASLIGVFSISNSVALSQPEGRQFNGEILPLQAKSIF
jgi:hypothetical protein